MQILIGIFIGWATMAGFVYFFFEWQNKKMFGDKPLPKRQRHHYTIDKQ